MAAEHEQAAHRTDASALEAASQLLDVSADQAFLDVVADFDQSAPDSGRFPKIEVAADEEEVAHEDPAGASERGDGPAEEGATPYGRTSKPARSIFESPQTRPGGQEKEYVTVQGWTSKPFALGEQLSQDTIRRSPDYFSLYDIAPQPDGGRGMAAMARAFVDRERTRIRTADQPVDKTVVWAYTHSGLDVREFLANVRELDADGSVSGRISVVLATDSQARLDAIEKSGILEGWDVSPKLIDPYEPDDITLPKNTGIALLPDTLDKLPAHQVLKGAKSHKVMELLETAQTDASQPLVRVEQRSGQARIVPPDLLGAHEVAEGAERFDIVAQLTGKLGKSATKPFELQYTDLATSDTSVAAFLEAMPERRRENGTVYNYSENVLSLVQAVTSGVRDDGLVYISGPLRNKDWLPKDKLATAQGPVISHVLEEIAIRNAVAATVREDAIYSVHGAAAGNRGYLVIDRGTDFDRIQNTRATFEQAVGALDPESRVAIAAAQLEAAREPLRALASDTSATVADRTEAALQARKAYDGLAAIYPQARRDSSLALALARECNAAQSRNEALAFARDSVAAAPHLSGAYVEMAKAEIALGHTDAARKLLVKTYDLSPRNPEMYKTLLDMWDGDEKLKDANLLGYVEAASGYLNYTPNLTSDEIIDKLGAISQALRKDWQKNSHDARPYKTILVQDLETGEIRKRQLTVSEMKQIIAADTALISAEVAGQLRNYEEADDEHGLLFQTQSKLFEIWLSVVPRDADDMPLARDLWPDRSQSRTERWIYNGSIYQDDAAAQPPEPGDIKPYGRSMHSDSGGETAYVDSDERPLESRTSMTIGEATTLTKESAGAFEIYKQTLPGHMFITGRTRMGKTTLLGNMFEQLPPMNVNFWAFDLGDKSELAEVGEALRAKDLSGDSASLVEMAESLKAQGTPVVIIAPGDKDSIPVTVDLFTPVEGCSIEEHIGKFVDTWITAYGGGGDSPVGPILSGALRDIYAANGWPVKPIPGETLPEVAGGTPTTPTLRELLDACLRRSAEYGKGTDAGNIPVYFKKRIEALEAGDFGDFLVGENVLDWEELFKSNVIFDFSRITSHDQRRFLFTALTMQASNYLQFHKGLSKEVKTVWAMDEASLITQGANEGDHSRQQGVEAFTSRLRVLGGYGVSIWSATQTLEGVDSVFLSQNAATIGLALKHANDKKEFLNSIGVEEGTELYSSLFARLTAAERGTAFAWTDGMEEPVIVNVEKPEEPTKQQLERARQWKVRPPIKANPYDGFTTRQREEAMRTAQSSKQAWKRIFVGAVTLAHVANIELPSVPEALKRQWAEETDAEAGGDPEFERLVLYELVKQAVQERTSAIRTSYPPRELVASVMAHATGMLHGESGAGTVVSPAFSLLSIRQAITYRKLTNPRFDKTPRSQQLTGPFAYAMPNPVTTVQKDDYRQIHGRRQPKAYRPVSDRLAALSRHDLSPVNGAHAEIAEKNSRTGFVGMVGQDSGAPFWQSIRYATGGELNLGVQRRLIAAQLGYTATSFSPEGNDFEELLALSTYLYKRLPKKKSAKTAKA